MNKALACYLIGMNLLGLILMGTDKSLARRHKWRIAERTLFLTAALGGAFGSWLGMYLFRHKTKHWYFVVFMPLLSAAWGAAIWLIFFSF